MYGVSQTFRLRIYSLSGAATSPLHRSCAKYSGTRFSDTAGGVAAASQANRRKHVGKEKKSSEKALIPLPPTGLASFFCANADVVQTNLQPKRAAGLCRGSAIAQNAKSCREMKRACTAARGAVTDGVLLEYPIPLGENF